MVNSVDCSRKNSKLITRHLLKRYKQELENLKVDVYFYNHPEYGIDLNITYDAPAKKDMENLLFISNDMFIEDCIRGVKYVKLNYWGNLELDENIFKNFTKLETLLTSEIVWTPVFSDYGMSYIKRISVGDLKLFESSKDVFNNLENLEEMRFIGYFYFMDNISNYNILQNNKKLTQLQIGQVNKDDGDFFKYNLLKGKNKLEKVILDLNNLSKFKFERIEEMEYVELDSINTIDLGILEKVNKLQILYIRNPDITGGKELSTKIQKMTLVINNYSDVEKIFNWSFEINQELIIHKSPSVSSDRQIEEEYLDRLKKKYGTIQIEFQEWDHGGKGNTRHRQLFRFQI